MKIIVMWVFLVGGGQIGPLQLTDGWFSWHTIYSEDAEQECEYIRVVYRGQSMCLPSDEVPDGPLARIIW